MKKIIEKIVELLAKSAVEIDYANGWDENLKKMKEQEALMNELEALAIAEKTVLGRTIRFPMADSYALYVVTKVNKTRVNIEWVDFCDGWVDQRCGKFCSIDRNYVEKDIKGQDALAELFGKRVVTV